MVFSVAATAEQCEKSSMIERSSGFSLTHVCEGAIIGQVTP
jgi:hypothetical protein